MASNESGPLQGSTGEDRRRWLDEPRNVDRICYLLYGTCAVLALLDVLHVYHKHGHFAWVDWPNFFGFFGFVACVLLVLAAKQLRKLVQRPEDYYDR